MHVDLSHVGCCLGGGGDAGGVLDGRRELENVVRSGGYVIICIIVDHACQSMNLPSLSQDTVAGLDICSERTS